MKLREFVQNNHLAIAIFILAVVVRLGLFFVYLNFNHGSFIDTIRGADGYFEISQNLIAGNGYSDEAHAPFIPNAMRPPAWIMTMAFIAWLFHSYIPVFIFQLALSSLVPILGMYLASRIIPTQYSPIVGLLLALEPAAIYSTTMVVSESSFTFIFLAFLVFIFRYLDTRRTREIIFAGICVGLAILIKPTVQFLPIVIPIFLLAFYRKELNSRLWKQLLYFVVICAVVLFPWVYRNKQAFGVYGLTAQAGYNLYTVLVPTVLSIDRGTNFDSEVLSIAKIPTLPGGPASLSNQSYYTKYSLGILREHKLALMKSVGVSIITFFTHDHMLTVLGYAGVTIPNVLTKPAIVLLLTNPAELLRDIFMYALSPGIFILLGRFFWIIVTLLFFSGAVLYFRREKFSAFALLGLLMVAYFAVLTSVNGYGMNGRFRIPINTFIFTFAVYGFLKAKDFIVQKLVSHHA